MVEKLNIQWVVDQNLCLGCGTCVSVCNHNAIKMVETPSGLLFAEVDDPQCNYCGLCMHVCPGTHLEKELIPPDVDPFKGNIVAAYCGQSLEKDILHKGQSGGVATALLCYLLDSGRIDRALVTQMPEDGSLRPKCILTNDKEKIYHAQGSKYCPVALNEFISDKFLDCDKKVAIVGLPCHIHGLRNKQCYSKQNETDLLMIGLICDRILSYVAINHLIDNAGETQKNIIAFQYRNKKWRGWPGDVYFRTQRGDVKYLSKTHRFQIKDTYTPLACRLCFDKMNILSDIVLGDAYKVREDKDGYSVVIARTQKGQDILLAARDAGALQLDSIKQEDIFNGQRVERRRRDWTAYIHVWKQMGGFAPDFSINKCWQADIQNISLKLYTRNLEWAKYLANRKSQSEVLKASKRHLRFQRWKGRLLPHRIIGFLWRRLKRLGKKILLIETYYTLEH